MVTMRPRYVLVSVSACCALLGCHEGRSAIDGGDADAASSATGGRLAMGTGGNGMGGNGTGGNGTGGNGTGGNLQCSRSNYDPSSHYPEGGFAQPDADAGTSDEDAGRADEDAGQATSCKPDGIWHVVIKNAPQAAALACITDSMFDLVIAATGTHTVSFGNERQVIVTRDGCNLSFLYGETLKGCNETLSFDYKLSLSFRGNEAHGILLFNGTGMCPIVNGRATADATRAP